MALVPRTRVPRKGLKPVLTLTDLYVLASRVQRGDRLYVIGFDPSKESDHLRKLRHSAMLGIWRGGYDDATGRWSAPRAARVAAALASLRTNRTGGGRQARKNRNVLFFCFSH